MQHPMSSMPPPAHAASAPLPMLHSLELPPFVDELPLPEKITGQHRVRVTMREVHAKVHRDVPATRFWSYGETALAPVIEARSHQPLHVEWVNQLPQHHFLPIDYTLHGCGHDVPEVRACVHLHGAKAPPQDDGQPEDWFVPGQSRTCTYPLQQDATALWYHDHAMGLNRLNMYAGLVGQFLIRDDAEDRLNLPAGKYEIPLTLYDRDFTRDGQLFYPVSPDPAKPWVSEFLADAILINGKIRPFLNVEPRLYRFRLLDAANSRFFSLSIAGATEPSKPPKPHIFHQIGTDQGLLAAPVPSTVLNLAPGERADLLVDFSQFAGQTVHLRNAAFDILEFRVASGKPEAPKSLLAQLRIVPKPDPTTATVTRTITLNEYQDNVGNSMLMLLNRKHWHEPVTETPKLNSTEIWEFVNQTEDVHPMHLHLVRFQILDRRTFDTFDYLMHKNLRFLAPATQPAENEAGWKDVVQCPPGQITRILVHFEGYAGRYLYHCHILEHEANDMMRPFEVIA
jgi:spore coat protein A